VEYYRQNAGFFFIIIGFAFGLLRPVEHLALATYFVHSYFLQALLSVVWTLYTLKTIQFTGKVLAQQENLFLSNLYLLPLPVKWRAFMLVQFILYEPIVLYSAFMAWLALRYHQHLTMIWLVLFNMISIGAAAFYYLYRLKLVSRENKQSKLANFSNRNFTKPYFTFFLHYLLHKQLSLFGLTKLFSLLLIAVTVPLYIIEGNSFVLLSLGTLGAFMANSVICFHFNRFEQADVLLFKNLPLSLTRRFCYNVLTYTCLLLPEIALLLRHLAGNISWWPAVKLLLFGISLPLVLHSYSLYRQLDLEKYIRHIFFIFIFFFACILFRIDVVLLAVNNMLISFFIYHTYFYQAESVIVYEEVKE
jgi:hypothetical protein